MTTAWRPPQEPAALGDPDDVVMLIVGPSFCLADVAGDVTDGAPLGWFVADRRVLSRAELFVDGGRCESLGVHRHDAFESLHVLRTPPGTQSGLLLVRHRALDEGLVDRIQVFNHATTPRTCRLVLKVDVDFADLFAVKDRRPIDRTEPGTTTGLACVDGVLHYTWTAPGGATRRTTIEASPSSATVMPGRVVWTLEIDSQEHAEVGVAITHELLDTGLEPPRHRARALVVSSRDQARAWERSLPTVVTGNAAVDVAVRRSGADLGSLRLFDPEDREFPVVAAGAPWFMTLFGRDSLITSLFSMHVDHGLARGVVRALARLQGDVTDDETDEQPGKILHELRFTQATSFSLRAGAPYYGSVDATPLFVHLVGELARWGAFGEAEIRAGLPAIDLALDWMLGAGDIDRDGFVEYHCRSVTGLVNQGWKDSWDGIRHGDGSIAEPPIALAEVQAYVFAAFHARARLAELLGDGTGAATWSSRAAALADRFNDRFWLGADKGFAAGLDLHNQPIDSVTSSMGHCLWTGIAAPEHADAVAKLLMSPPMWTGWGIRTLSSDNPGYDPLSYHCGSVWPHDSTICAAGLMRYGFVEEAQRIAAGLFAASQASDGRLPELLSGIDRGWVDVPVRYPTSCTPQAWSAASPLYLLRILLGIEPSDDRGSVVVDPQLPTWLQHVHVDGVPVGSQRFSITANGRDSDVRVSPERPPAGD
ncbi:MAG: glycogen debranching N-terminal domain-containing protein [Acidimicrobiia bacterium]